MTLEELEIKREHLQELMIAADMPPGWSRQAVQSLSAGEIDRVARFFLKPGENLRNRRITVCDTTS